MWTLFAGISVKTVCETTCILNNVEEESRKTNTGKVARLLDHSKVLSESLYGRTFANGRYISTLYLVCKALFLLNAVVQFFLLKVLLGVNDSLWGYRVTKNLLNGVQWEETGHFPRVTVCDFEVRELGNLHRHSVQCVLMVNMFNEKIFMLIWWWFLILMFINGFSLIEWMIVILVEPLNVRLVRDYLSTLKHPPLSAKETELYLREFIHYCLRSDGTFLLRLVSTNAGDAVSRDMVEYLWNQFLCRKQRRTLSDLGHSPLPCAPYDAPSPDDTIQLEHTYSGDEEGVQNQSKFRENAKESTL